MNRGCLKSQNPLTAEVAKLLRKDRKILIIWILLCVLSAYFAHFAVKILLFQQPLFILGSFRAACQNTWCDNL